MRGQIQQPNAAPQYDNAHPASHSGEAADAVMARWLQSAGLQHLASPTSTPALDPRFLPNMLMQHYARHGVHTIEDRQKLFRLVTSINSGLEPLAEPSTPPAYGSRRHDGVDGLPSPEMRGEIGAGILDLHAIDTELLGEDVSFESYPFVAVTDREYENDPEVLWSSNKLQGSKQRTNTESIPMRSTFIEKEMSPRDSSSSVARIKVVVRKRPLNKKEIARKEEDIVTIDGQACSLTVHEPKLKVDLTAYVEKHDFVFDAVLNDQVTNDEVYKVTVEPIIPTIFQRTKATCFAYGQTGSGKTFTMQPLPLRACQDMLNLMQHPSYKNQGLQLWFSFFEIYGGKLYDLVNDRRKLQMREDGRQQVCIVGLKEFAVSDVQLVKEYIEKGNALRSTGSTGANEESSRSHAILQLIVKKHSNNKERGGKLVGKFSFIDLAGSERGADTTDNDRQTRIEGAEINKSLLALKECIRALDHEQGHIPFRGSKLTEVLRDSFVGDSRTVMISCISPNTGSCEHTLNTLRYADRVKGLSKSGSVKRDPSPSIGVQIQRDSTTSSSPPLSPKVSDNNTEFRIADTSKRPEHWHSQLAERDPWSIRTSFNQALPRREDIERISITDVNKPANVRNSMSAESLSSQHDPAGSVTFMDRNEQERVSSPQQHNIVKAKNMNRVSNEKHKNEGSNTVARQSLYKEEPAANAAQSRKRDPADTFISQSEYDGHITAILEEEEDMIAAHRLEVEDTMELVREEMKLLTEVDRPGSSVEWYVSQLSYVLSRKAAGIVNLQARLARFQHHLKEQEILSEYMGKS